MSVTISVEGGAGPAEAAAFVEFEFVEFEFISRGGGVKGRERTTNRGVDSPLSSEVVRGR